MKCPKCGSSMYDEYFPKKKLVVYKCANPSCRHKMRRKEK